MPSNSEIREWYLEQVSRIDLEDAKLELAGVSVAERARRAYGAEDGPAFDQLFEKHSRRGLPDDAV